MKRGEKTGLLLVNLGTPDSPKVSDVRRYLREFLFDPRVIDTAAWKRWLLLNLIILPLRPKQSAEAYEKIWTDRGSPLMFHTSDLAEKVRKILDPEIVVDVAMRYGQPSIPEALKKMRERGVQRLIVFPQYPQYSSAATGSSLEHVFQSAGELWNVPYIQVVPPFYDNPLFIDAYAQVARPHLHADETEVFFFSFHGLPERQVRKSDDTGRHCLAGDDCCSKLAEANRNCYRAQCFATARALADRLEIPEEKRIVCFQSRLGRDPWIRPYTDELIVREAKRGRKRAVIFSPAFTADCLETLEELGIRAAEDWKANGGDWLHLVPCLNSDDLWAEALVGIAREHTRGLELGGVPIRG